MTTTTTGVATVVVTDDMIDAVIDAIWIDQKWRWLHEHRQDYGLRCHVRLGLETALIRRSR